MSQSELVNKSAMTGQLDKVLHYHLRFYQLLGFHGIPLPGDAHPMQIRKWLQFWSFILMTGFGTVAVMCISSEDEFIHKGDMFNSFNDVLKYLFGGIAVVSIYLETLVSHRHLARFWQLHGFLTALSRPSYTRKWDQHRHFLSWLYGLALADITLVYFCLIRKPLRHHLVLFWVTFLPFVWLVHARNKQFILHMELLHQQLCQLEEELDLLVEYSTFASRCASFKGFEDYLRRQLRQKQLFYDKIYDMYICFQATFKYSMLTVLLMIGVRISVDCYFMYYTIYNDSTNIDYLLIVPAFFEIPAFIYTSRNCMEMIPKLSYKLHSIATGQCFSYYPALSCQIQNFSLQLMHQPVIIHAFGITILDTYLLTRLACSLSTYTIYSIQFMPKLRGNV